MLKLGGSRKGRESVLGGAGNGQLSLRAFNNQKNYIDSVEEDRSGSIRVNGGDPKEGVPGKMMSSCTDIVEAERKRSGWF